MASLVFLFCASDARAGTYTWKTTDAGGSITAQSPDFSQSEGTYTVFGPGGASTPFAYKQGTSSPVPGYGSVSGFGGDSGGVFGPSCTGAIKAKFTWQHDNSSQNDQNDPPPALVILAETSLAMVTLSGSSSPYTCDNGIGGQATQYNNSVVVYSTRYAVKPGGASFTVTCSPTASVSGSSGPAAAVRYTPTVYPVTVDLAGVTLTAGGRQVLTGQQVTATLNLHGAPLPLNVPAAPALPPVVWTVGGSTFKSYPWNQPVCHVVPLADSDKQGMAVSFYTKKDKDPITIHFAGDLKVPAGASPQPTLHLAVDADVITSVKPVVTNWTITPGLVDKQGSGNGTTFGLFGIPDSTTALQGETWKDVAVKVPDGFSGGTACFAQIRAANRVLYRKVIATAPSNAPAFYHEYRNGDAGLDSSYPYQFITNNMYTWSVASANPVAGDSPAQCVSIADQDQGGTQWYSSTAADTFDTYVMYQPPSNNNAPTTYVPLQHYQWKWSGRMDLLNSALDVDLVNGTWQFVTRYPSPSVSTDTPITLKRKDVDDHPEWDFIRPSPFLLQP